MTCSEDIHSMSMDIINILIKYEVLLIERSTVYTSWINVLRLNNDMEGAKHCGNISQLLSNILSAFVTKMFSSHYHMT